MSEKSISKDLDKNVEQQNQEECDSAEIIHNSPTTPTTTGMSSYEIEKKRRRKPVIIKTSIYMGEILLLMVIASFFKNPLVGAMIGIIGGILFTIFTNWLYKVLNLDEKSGQSAVESGKEFVNNLASNFDKLPRFLQDKLASLSYSGMESCEERQLPKLQEAHQLLLGILQGCQEARSGHPEVAKIKFEQAQANATKLKNTVLINLVEQINLADL